MDDPGTFGVLLGLALLIGLVLLLNRSPRDKNGRQEDTSDALKGDFTSAKVKQVIDGDTVVVALGWEQETLRLIGIDCPEDDQAWGDTARYGLIKLIGGRNIQYERHGQDKYGRTLATIFTRQGDDQRWVNVNARMVTLGHAWVSRVSCRRLPSDKKSELFRLQRWARSNRVGLWKNPNPTPPWRWRDAARPMASIDRLRNR